MKKKRQTFSVSKAVKAAAREKIGAPPPTREIPDAKSRERRRAAKHKQSLQDLLSPE